MNQAERFRALHEQFLVLANAWDAGSARVAAKPSEVGAFTRIQSGLRWRSGRGCGERSFMSAR